METKRKEIVRLYDRMDSDLSLINAWRDPDEFPYATASPMQLEHLKHLSVLEIVFSREEGYYLSADTMFEAYDKFVGKLFKELHKSSYLFFSDFQAKEKSKLRSYKGILPKKLIETPYVQKEVEISENKTVIAAFVELGYNPSKMLIDYFTEGQARFALDTYENEISENNLIDVVKKCMTHRGTSVVNFIALLDFFNDPHNVLYRMSGDGGNRYVSLQIFFNKIRSTSLPSILHDYLKETVLNKK